MLEIYVIINVFIIFFFLKRRLILIKRQNYLTIFDGVFFGGIFFIIIPICYSFFIGKISLDGLKTFESNHDYELVIYAITSITFFGFCSFFSKNKKICVSQISSFEMNFFSLTLILYFFALIISFVSSGKLNGSSHWYKANEELYGRSSFFVLLGQIHNVSRVIVPGMCLYFQLIFLKRGKFFKPHFIIALLLILFELFLAGNRIVMLFFIFSIFIPLFIYKKYKKISLIILVCFPLIFVAKFWPMVRGMMWAEKVSIERFVEVVSIAYEMEVVTDEAKADPLLLLTEGSNIVPLKFIFDSYPLKYDYTYGDTMILKSIGTLIPKSVWPSKPEGNGILIGRKAFDKDTAVYLNSTILGDAWVNFSWFGVFYIFLVLLMVQNCFYMKYYPLLSSVFFMIAVASWRFDFAFYFISIYLLLFLFALIKISIVKNICSYFSKFIFKIN